MPGEADSRVHLSLTQTTQFLNAWPKRVICSWWSGLIAGKVDLRWRADDGQARGHGLQEVTMIPHPTTWQTDRERERQRLLASAERHKREAIVMIESPRRWRAVRSRNAGHRHAGHRTAVIRAMRRPAFSTPRGGTRLVARLLTMFT
jgi:hypothetical protein